MNTTNEQFRTDNETLTSMYNQLEEMRSRYSAERHQLHNEIKDGWKKARTATEEELKELDKQEFELTDRESKLINRQRRIVEAMRGFAEIIGGDLNNNFDWFELIK